MSVTAVLFQSDVNLFSAGTIDGLVSLKKERVTCIYIVSSLIK